MRAPVGLIPLPDRVRAALLGATAIKATGEDWRWAAVGAILAPDPDAILVIRRAAREADPWSGQLALPGGRYQADDRDLLHTAIRETREEVGVALDRARAAGALDDVAPLTPVLPPVAVRPFVFVLDHAPPLELGPEVASAAWVPLDSLLAPGAHRQVRVTIRGAERETPAFLTPAGPIWGLTERILAPLLSRLGQQP